MKVTDKYAIPMLYALTNFIEKEITEAGITDAHIEDGFKLIRQCALREEYRDERFKDGGRLKEEADKRLLDPIKNDYLCLLDKNNALSLASVWVQEVVNNPHFSQWLDKTRDQNNNAGEFNSETHDAAVFVDFWNSVKKSLVEGNNSGVLLAGEAYKLVNTIRTNFNLDEVFSQYMEFRLALLMKENPQYLINKSLIPPNEELRAGVHFFTSLNQEMNKLEKEVEAMEFGEEG